METYSPPPFMIPHKDWVNAAYRLEIWAHAHSFKINPCNGKEIWPVVECRTVIIPPIHKPQIGRPPKKRKKSVDELASQSCGASQVGGSSQQSQRARHATGARNVSRQAAGSSQQSQAPRQAASARNTSSQVGGSSQLSQGPRQCAGARNASSQASSSSQPSVVPSQASQGPSQHSAD
ncbi:hypothetical protein Tco_0294252 [Tanacetum coccineum]